MSKSKSKHGYLRLVVALVFTAAAVPAMAVPAPQLVPVRDVTVDYEVLPPDQAPISVRVAVAAGGMRLRIVGQDLPTTFLVDRQNETAAILLPMLRTYTSVKIGRYDPTHTVLRGADFSRSSRDQVAGMGCTVWVARSAEGSATACVTGDGVILAGEAHSNRKGLLGRIRAQRVSYGTLPPAMFDIPPDFSESPLGEAAAQFLK